MKCSPQAITKGVISFFIVCLCFTLPHGLSAQKTDNWKYDISYLKQALDTTSTARDSVRIYRYLGRAYRDMDIDSSLYFGQYAIEYAKKRRDTLSIIDSYIFLGKSYEIANKPIKQRSVYLQALELGKKVQDEWTINTTQNKLGLAYWRTAVFDSAIHYMVLNYQYYLDHDFSKHSVMMEAANMALVFLDMGDYNKSREYFFKSLNYLNEARVEDPEGYDIYDTIYLYDTLAQLGLKEQKPDSILKYTAKMDSVIHLSDESFFNSSVKSLALQFHAYYITKDEAHFKPIAQQLEAYITEDPDLEEFDEINRALSLYYAIEEDWNKSLLYAQRFYNSQNMYIDVEDKAYAAYELASVYEHLGQYDKAYYLLKEHEIFLDSLYDIRRSSLALQYREQYESDQKEKEILSLQLIDSQRQSEINLQYAILSGSFLLLALALFFGRQRKKQLNLLEKKNQQIEEQTETLRLLNESKDRLFANISHEFRTPLSIILAEASQLLAYMQEHKLDDLSDRSHSIRYNVQRLVKLVDDILDLSKLEAGQSVVQEKCIHIATYLEIIAASYHSYAAYKEIDLDIRISKSLQAYIKTDPSILETILHNLIGNAIKYCNNGDQIILSAEFNQSELSILVEDSGPGIKNEDIPHIFDRFYQGDKSSNTGGVGIGLALCTELSKQIKGKLSVESELGVGSVFKFQVPVKQAKRAECEQVYTPELGREANSGNQQLDEKELKNRKYHQISLSSLSESTQRILIVEDNVEMNRLIRESLANYFQYEVAHDGAEALEMIKSKHYDLMVTDAMMPQMDGFELLKAVRNHPKTEDIPVIMLTALATAKHKLKALELGASEYLTKPFDGKELITRIENLLHLSNKKRAASPLADGERNHKDQKLIEELENYVVSHLQNTELSVVDLANHVALSERQLRRRLKDATGMSSKVFLQEIRLQHAHHILSQNRDLRVSELAEQVGYTKASYFSEIFKKRFGYSPTQL